MKKRTEGLWGLALTVILVLLLMVLDRFLGV